MSYGQTFQRCILMAIVASANPITTSNVIAADEKPRSLYFSVTFELCPHLEKGWMYEDDKRVAPLPFKRVFQFTYNPSKARFFPAYNDLEVSAQNAATGEVIRGQLRVSPGEIHIGDTLVYKSRDNEIKAQRSRKRDAHFKGVTLTINCEEQSPKLRPRRGRDL